jgi:hypothetical protein
MLAGEQDVETTVTNIQQRIDAAMNPIVEEPTGTVAPQEQIDLVTTPTTPAQVFAQTQSTVPLFEYIPSQWIDWRPAAHIGPAIYFLDIARMRTDLGLSDVAEASRDETRLALIEGLNTQGLYLAYPSILPLRDSALEQWGWDIMDIAQVLYLPDLETSIILGNFGRPEITERILEKGYEEQPLREFTYFEKHNQYLKFAIKPDTLIISPHQSVIENLIQQKADARNSSATHPSVTELFGHAEGMWGAYLAASGDLAAFDKQTLHRLDEFWSEQAAETLKERYGLEDLQSEAGWSLMMIAFWGSEEATQLRLLYLYPLEEEATADMELVKTTLTETPSFRDLQKTWSDFVTLESVQVQDNVLIAQVITEDESLLGDSIRERDFFGFLPIRYNP